MLRLVGFEGQEPMKLSFADDPVTAVPAFADALLNLARHLTQKWARETNLADVLPTQLPTSAQQPAMEFLTTAWEYAQPHLRLGLSQTAANVVDREPIAAVGIPANVHNADDGDMQQIGVTAADLQNRLATTLEPCATVVVPVTDRTALALVREYRLMPIATLPEFQQMWQDYARNAGQETDRQVDSPLQAAVFAAERQALEFERRLEYQELLNQDFRLFHPLIVLGLARPELAELYGLALAAGWVQVTDNKTPILQPPGGSRTELSLLDREEASGGQHPLVAGYLRFTAGLAADADLVKQINQAIQDPSDELQDTWRRYLNSFQPPVVPVKRYCQGGYEILSGEPFCRNTAERRKPGAFCTVCGQRAERWDTQMQTIETGEQPFSQEKQGVQDLIALAALVTYRRLAPADWDSLIMKRARKVR